MDHAATRSNQNSFLKGTMGQSCVGREPPRSTSLIHYACTIAATSRFAHRPRIDALLLGHPQQHVGLLRRARRLEGPRQAILELELGRCRVIPRPRAFRKRATRRAQIRRRVHAVFVGRCVVEPDKVSRVMSVELFHVAFGFCGGAPRWAADVEHPVVSEDETRGQRRPERGRKSYSMSLKPIWLSNAPTASLTMPSCMTSPALCCSPSNNSCLNVRLGPQLELVRRLAAWIASACALARLEARSPLNPSGLTIAHWRHFHTQEPNLRVKHGLVPSRRTSASPLAPRLPRH